MEAMRVPSPPKLVPTRRALALSVKPERRRAAGTLLMVSTLTIEFFQGEQRAKMMGYCAAIGMLGGMFYTYVGGILGELGWQFSFLAYLVGVPIFLCLLFLFPAKIKTGSGKEAAFTSKKLPGELFWIAGVSMVYIILYFAYTNNISLFVSNTKLGSATQAGLSYSIVNGSGFIGGLFFGALSRRFKEHVFELSAVTTALGFVLVGISKQLSVLYLGSVFLGLGLAWFLPQSNLRISAVVSQNQLSLAYGMNSAISNLGQFLSVFVLSGLCGVLDITDQRDIFYLAFWGNLVVAGILLGYTAGFLPKMSRQSKGNLRA